MTWDAIHAWVSPSARFDFIKAFCYEASFACFVSPLVSFLLSCVSGVPVVVLLFWVWIDAMAFFIWRQTNDGP